MQSKMFHLKQLNKHAEVIQTAKFSQNKYYLNLFIQFIQF